MEDAMKEVCRRTQAVGDDQLSAQVGMGRHFAHRRLWPLCACYFVTVSLFTRLFKVVLVSMVVSSPVCLLFSGRVMQFKWNPLLKFSDSFQVVRRGLSNATRSKGVAHARKSVSDGPSVRSHQKAVAALIHSCSATVAANRRAGIAAPEHLTIARCARSCSFPPHRRPSCQKLPQLSTSVCFLPRSCSFPLSSLCVRAATAAAVAELVGCDLCRRQLLRNARRARVYHSRERHARVA